MQAIQMSAGNQAGSRIAVTIDGSDASKAAVQHAVATARQTHGRLTIIAIAPKPWTTVALSGICPLQLQREMMEYIERVARRLGDSVPADVPCTTVVRCGRAAREAARYLRGHPHNVLITTGREARRGPRRRTAPPAVSPA